MSDRPSPANGKRDLFWGTLRSCGICGRCLCYACHPRGPCADERTTAMQVHPPGTRTESEAPASHA